MQTGTTARKRTRSSLAVLGDIDGLLGISAVDEAIVFVGDNGELNSPQRANKEDDFAGASVLQRCRRVQSSPANAPLSPTTPSASTNVSTASTVDSLGGDEIDLLRRKDEEMADMALFLAKAVAEAPSPLSMRELVDFLAKAGVPRVLLALKRAEATEAFVQSLYRAHPTHSQRILLLRLLLEFLHLAEVEVFSHTCVIAFLVESLAPPSISQQSERAPSSSLPTRMATHWSTRRKRVESSAASPPPAPTERRVDELDERALSLCLSSSTMVPSASHLTSTALSLQALLTLVFRHNQGLLLASPSVFSVSLSFAQAGGLERMAQLLLDKNTSETALSLLEVLTSFDVLRRESGRLLQLVPTLVHQLSTVGQATQVAVLKVMTNITNLLPSALSDTGTASLFVEFMQHVLLHPGVEGDSDERETFVLCCAINVVKYEAKEGVAVHPTFTRAFMASADLLPALADNMTKRHQCNDAVPLVLSGYAALLLAALSLVNVVDAEMPSLRTPVMAAVAVASRGTRIGKSTNHQPMRMVAAIIQEFLLFQSASGTLTKEALVEIDFLVSRLRQCNDIAVTEDAEGEAQKSSKEDDDDDVTLGDLL